MKDKTNEQLTNAGCKRDIKRKLNVLIIFDIFLMIFFAVFIVLGAWLLSGRRSSAPIFLIFIVIFGSVGFLVCAGKIIFKAMCYRFGRKAFAESYKILVPQNTENDTTVGLNYGIKFDYVNKNNKLITKKERMLPVTPFVFNQVTIKKLPIKISTTSK